MEDFLYQVLPGAQNFFSDVKDFPSFRIFYLHLDSIRIKTCVYHTFYEYLGLEKICSFHSYHYLEENSASMPSSVVSGNHSVALYSEKVRYIIVLLEKK